MSYRLSSLLSHTRTRHEKNCIITTHTRRVFTSSICPTAAYFTSLFCEFSLFRDNSVLALHQFCVVFNSVFKLFFYRFESRQEIEFSVRSRRREEENEKEDAQSFHLFDFRMCFCYGSPALFIFEFIVAEFVCFVNGTDIHVNLFANLLATHHIIRSKKFAEVE